MSAAKDGLAGGVAGTLALVGEVVLGVSPGSLADASEEGLSSAGSEAPALASAVSAGGGAILAGVCAGRAAAWSEGGGLPNRHIATTATIATMPMTVDIHVSFFMPSSFLRVSGCLISFAGDRPRAGPSVNANTVAVQLSGSEDPNDLIWIGRKSWQDLLRRTRAFDQRDRAASDGSGLEVTGNGRRYWRTDRAGARRVLPVRRRELPGF